MIFLKPEYLYMMIVPLIIFFFFVIKKREPIEEYFDESVLQRLRFDNDSLGRVGRNMMIFVALFFMIIALARPVKLKKDIEVEQKSIDMVIALDVSKSMMAKDFYPNRLEFAKKKIKEFIEEFDEARIGIIAFSDVAFLVAPITYDRQSLEYLLDHLSFESVSSKGSDLNVALIKASDFLGKKEDKIVVLFSDGGDDRVLDDEIALAKDENETIYIYGVGSKKGSVIEDKNGVLKDKEGNIVITKLNDKLKGLALKSGGAYIVASYDTKGVKLLADEIKKSFELKHSSKFKTRDYEELFYYPLSLSLLFMLFLFHSLPRRGVLLLLLLCMTGTPRIEARVFDFFDIKDANSAYKKGEYKKALKYFQDITLSKRSPQSYYDLANAYYKNGDFKGAIKVYKSIQTSDPNLHYKRMFNIGNSYFKLGKYQKAIESYEAAKRFKSEDDLIFNLELAKKMLKKQQEKKKKKSSKQEKKKKEQNKKQKDSGRGDNDKKKKSKTKKDKQNQKKKKSNQAKESKGKNQKAKEQKKLTKKEIKMWQEHLEKMKTKTKPIELKVEKKRKKDVNPW